MIFEFVGRQQSRVVFNRDICRPGVADDNDDDDGPVGHCGMPSPLPELCSEAVV